MQHHGYRVAGRDETEDAHHRRQVGVGNAGLTAKPGNRVPDVRVAAQHGADVVGDRAEGGPVDQRGSGPADQAGSLQPPGQGERAAQPPSRLRRTGPWRRPARPAAPPRADKTEGGAGRRAAGAPRARGGPGPPGARPAGPAAKNNPDAPTASPMAAEPLAGNPMAACPAKISRASTQLASAASSTPTAGAAFRPTAVEPTRSSRPVSSSALVCMITMKMLIRAAAKAEAAPTL